VIGLAAAIAIIFYGATEIGLPLYGIIAGLGVGGLALGLAARPTLENLIGGIILYADRPVRVGDFAEFGNKMGVVEEIGLRSTRVRSLDRTIITVPNAEFSNMQIINHSRRDSTMLRTTIALKAETTTEQMHEVLDRLRKSLSDHADVDPASVRVRFKELTARSLNVELRAYIKRPSYGELLAVQEELLFRIKQIIEESGTGIAAPPPPPPADAPKT
jgi:MscS family membrane protein